MKIDVGNFGFQVPSGGETPAAQPAAFVDRGLDELGKAALAVGKEAAQGAEADAHQAALEQRQKALQAAAEAKQLAREAKRAQAITIQGKAQNDLAAAHDSLVQGIADGTVKTDDAPKLWAEQSAKIVDGHMGAVDKANVELVRAGLTDDVGKLGRSVNGAVVKQNRYMIGANLNDYLEQMQRLAVTDLTMAKKQGVMAIDAQGPLSGLNPEQVSKMRHSFIETATFNAANNRLVQIKDNRGALDAFLEDVAKMDDLDPGKKNILVGQARTQIVHLENKAIAAENRRLVTLQRVGTQLENRIAMGIPVDPTDLVNYQQAAKGTAFEEHAGGLVDEQNAVTELLKKPPAQQAAYVNGLRTELVTTGKGNAKLIGRLEKTVANTITMIDKNPVQYAENRTGAQPTALDLTKPDSWGEVLANRAQVIDAQWKTVGGGRSVLKPAEAATLAQMLEKGTPKDKVALLEPMRRAIGNDAIFTATIQQVAKDSPVTAMAATIATKESPIVEGNFFKTAYQPGDTAELLLRGEHLLNPTKGDKAQDGKGRGFQMPKGTEERAMVQRFNDTVGEVFAGAPDAYHAQLQAARAYYAAVTSDKNGGGSEELDADAWRRSIRATLPVVKFNGRAVAAPWGMGEDQFKDRVANAFPQALRAAGLPVDMAGATGRYTLQNLTGNTYLVRQGTEYLTGPKGRVVLEVAELPTSFRDARGRLVRDQVPQ